MGRTRAAMEVLVLRRPMRLLATTFLLASTASASPGAASAATVADRATGFHLPLDVPGGLVCITLPRDLQDPVGCRGLPADALASLDASNDTERAAVTALVRVEDWSFVVVLSHFDSPGLELSDRAGNAIMAEMRRSLPSSHLHGTAPGSTYDWVGPPGRRALRYFAEHDRAGAKIARQVGYLVAIPTGLESVAFFSDTAHMDRVRAIADASIFLARRNTSAVRSPTSMRSSTSKPPPGPVSSRCSSWNDSDDRAESKT